MLVLALGFLGVGHIHAFPTPAWTNFLSCPAATCLMAKDGLKSQKLEVAATITQSESADQPLSLAQLYTFQKPRQKRSATKRPRKPRFYWQSHENIRRELILFWEELNVGIDQDRPPPIPSEHLLNLFDRNDLRWGISQMGGRDNVSHMLGGAKIIPGKWIEAIEHFEVKNILPQIMQRDPKERSLSSLQHTNQDSTAIVTSTASVSSDTHNNSTIRRQTKVFWSKEKVIKEL
jgi:hypothetical protein